jgi:hypothetical protein
MDIIEMVMNTDGTRYGCYMLWRGSFSGLNSPP